MFVRIIHILTLNLSKKNQVKVIVFIESYNRITIYLDYLLRHIFKACNLWLHASIIAALYFLPFESL